MKDATKIVYLRQAAIQGQRDFPFGSYWQGVDTVRGCIMARARKGLVFLIEIDERQVVQRICVSTNSGIFWQRLCGCGGKSVFLDEEIPVDVVRGEVPAVAEKDMSRVREALEQVVQQLAERFVAVA